MYPENASSRNKKIITAIAVIAAIALLGAAAAVGAGKKEDNSLAISDTSSSQSSDMSLASSSNSSQTNSSSSASYKDGTYSADSSYISPGGTEQISVDLTIKDGVVTASKVSQHANNRDSSEYQSDFARNYKSFVVGKKLGDIKLSHVSGSSLTSEGFNEALQQIQNRAQTQS